MKTLMKTAFALSIVLLIFSCSKDSELEQPVKASFQLTGDEEDKLSCMGLLSAVTDIKEDYIILHDIVMNRQELQKMEELTFEGQADPSEAEDRQNAVHWNNVVDISRFPLNVFIDPSFTYNDYTAVYFGLSQWEFINQCQVTFNYVNSHAEADVSILDDSNTLLPASLQNLCEESGFACFAFNGRPGRFIAINRPVWNQTLTTRAAVVAHEMGHALGYVHANAESQFDAAEFTDACGNDQERFFLHGTPENALNSIMTTDLGGNGGSVLFHNNAGDARAAQLLYPALSAPGPISVTAAPISSPINLGGGMREYEINVVMPSAPAYYNVQITLTYTGGGSPYGNHNLTQVRLADRTRFTGIWRKGNYTVSVSGMNYKGDFLSPPATTELSL